MKEELQSQALRIYSVVMTFVLSITFFMVAAPTARAAAPVQSGVGDIVQGWKPYIGDVSEGLNEGPGRILPVNPEVGEGWCIDLGLPNPNTHSNLYKEARALTHALPLITKEKLEEIDQWKKDNPNERNKQKLIDEGILAAEKLAGERLDTVIHLTKMLIKEHRNKNYHEVNKVNHALQILLNSNLGDAQRAYHDLYKGSTSAASPRSGLTNENFEALTGYKIGFVRSGADPSQFYIERTGKSSSPIPKAGPGEYITVLAPEGYNINTVKKNPSQRVIVPDQPGLDKKKPVIKTEAAFGEGHTQAVAGATVNDTVTYEDLVPGKKYTLEAELINKAGQAVIGRGSAEFTAEDSGNGSVVVRITVNDGVTTPVAEAVAFETLKSNDAEAQENKAEGLPEGSAADVIAEHKDLEDAAQTVTSDAPKKASVELKKYIGDQAFAGAEKPQADGAGSAGVLDSESSDAAYLAKTGQELTITYEVTNTGELDLKDVSVADSLIADADNWGVKVESITPEKQDIAAGKSATFTATITAPADFKADNLHADKAKASGTPVDEAGTPVDYTDDKGEKQTAGTPVESNEDKAYAKVAEEPEETTPEETTTPETTTPGETTEPSTEETTEPTPTNEPTTEPTTKPVPEPLPTALTPSLKLKKYIGSHLMDKKVLLDEVDGVLAEYEEGVSLPTKLNGGTLAEVLKEYEQAPGEGGNELYWAEGSPALAGMKDAETADDYYYATAGQELYVTFAVANTGDAVMRNVTIKDDLIKDVDNWGVDVHTIHVLGKDASVKSVDKLMPGEIAYFVGEITAVGSQVDEDTNLHADQAQATGNPEDENGNPLDETGMPLKDGENPVDVVSNVDKAHAKVSPLPGPLPMGPTPIKISTTVEKPETIKGGDTVTDMVDHEGLTYDLKYTLEAELHHFDANGEDLGVIGRTAAPVEFTPAAADGSVKVPIVIDEGFTGLGAGEKAVAYEFLYREGWTEGLRVDKDAKPDPDGDYVLPKVDRTEGTSPVARHEDPTDTAQTIPAPKSANGSPTKSTSTSKSTTTSTAKSTTTSTAKSASTQSTSAKGATTSDANNSDLVNRVSEKVTRVENNNTSANEKVVRTGADYGEPLSPRTGRRDITAVPSGATELTGDMPSYVK